MGYDKESEESLTTYRNLAQIVATDAAAKQMHAAMRTDWTNLTFCGARIKQKTLIPVLLYGHKEYEHWCPECGERLTLLLKEYSIQLSLSHWEARPFRARKPNNGDCVSTDL